MDCNFSLTKIPGCRFVEADFHKSKLIGINWSETVNSSKSLIQRKPFDFNQCILNHSVFFGMNLREVTFQECSMINVNFEEANLSKANCTKSDFKQALFKRSNLTETNFTGALNYAINPQENTFKKTRFSLPEAVSLLYNLDIVLEDAPYGEQNA